MVCYAAPNRGKNGSLKFYVHNGALHNKLITVGYVSHDKIIYQRYISILLPQRTYSLVWCTKHGKDNNDTSVDGCIK